jgi:hypothetical protein
MNKALAMRSIEGTGYLGTKLQCLGNIELPPSQSLLQRFTFHKFHYEVIDAVLVSYIMKRTNVRMI